MVNRVFCDECGDEIIQIAPKEEADDALTKFIAKVKITYYRDLEALQEDDASQSLEFDFCSRDVLIFEERYGITTTSPEVAKGD